MTVPLRPSSFIHLEVIVLQSMAAAETTNFKLSTLASDEAPAAKYCNAQLRTYRHNTDPTCTTTLCHDILLNDIMDIIDILCTLLRILGIRTKHVHRRYSDSSIIRVAPEYY